MRVKFSDAVVDALGDVPSAVQKASSSKPKCWSRTSGILRYGPRSTMKPTTAGRPASTGAGASTSRSRTTPIRHRADPPSQEMTCRTARTPLSRRSNRLRDGYKGGRPSQRNCLVKHAVPNERMESTLFSDVHSTAEFLFQIDKQSAGEPRRRTRAGLDQ